MKFGKWMTGIGLAAAMLALVGCGAGGDGSHSAAPEKAKAKLVIGLDDNFPPIGFRDESGQLVGSDVDLATEAAKRLGYEVEFKPIDWSSKETELASGKIDVIWNGLTPTPERQKNMLFSIPYQTSGQVFFVAVDSDIDSVEDLAGKVVGTQAGATSEDVLAKNSDLQALFAELKKYPDFVSSFMDLKIGRVDAVFGTEIISRYYIEKSPGTMRVLDQRYGGETDAVAVGMKLGNETLKQEIDRVLCEMQKDGTTAKIMMKWYGADISYKGNCVTNS